MKILGVSALYHDSSACLLVDGDIVAFAEEERFNRRKHTNAYPFDAIEWVLSASGVRLDELDEVVFYLNPWNYLKTGVKAALANFPRSLALARKGAATVPPLTRLWQMSRLKRDMCERHGARGDFELVFLDHYRTHQASTFYASGFGEAAIVTMDFAVDGSTEVVARGNGTSIEDLVRHRVPHGFALVYATITHVLGFKWYDEFKVMGMGAYGEPAYLEAIERLYDLDPERGTLTLDLRYFDFQNYGMSRLYSERIKEIFGEPRRPGTEITQREYDIAASLQEATNRYGVAMARLARRLTGSRNLCMAGGVSQNCLMNQRICESGVFEHVFLQPLAGDVGCSLGAALYSYHAMHSAPRRYRMTHLYLGPEYRATSADEAAAQGLVARPCDDWVQAVARAIADGLVVGYFDGRMEAGPRALGSRSILADPRRADMKDILNARVKHREHFRPFAPSVLAEEVDTVFEPLAACESLDYMIVTMNVRAAWRERVPAITHQDGTARVQAVREEVAPNYHALISRFHELTGVPLVINTSFNDNEPIVCQPMDAIRCFKNTQIDLLVLDGTVYYREDNAEAVSMP